MAHYTPLVPLPMLISKALKGYYFPWEGPLDRQGPGLEQKSMGLDVNHGEGGAAESLLLWALLVGTQASSITWPGLITLHEDPSRLGGQGRVRGGKEWRTVLDAMS